MISLVYPSLSKQRASALKNICLTPFFLVQLDRHSFRLSCIQEEIIFLRN